MKKSFMIQASVLFVIGHVLTYTHHLIRVIDKDVAEMKVDLFLCPYPINYVSVEWYFKMLCDNLNLCIIYFTVSRIAYLLSDALLFVTSIFFFVHFIDLILFIYNFKVTASIYWILLFAIIGSVIAVLTKSRLYNYKSMI